MQAGAPTSRKSKRIDLRVTPSDDSILRAASEHLHVSLTDFVVQSALIRAETLIADRTRVELSEAAWREFSAALDAPEAVNERLARTAERASRAGYEPTGDDATRSPR